MSTKKDISSNKTSQKSIKKSPSEKEVKRVRVPSDSKTETMEELLRQYGSNIRSYTVGERVKGKVISIEPKRVLIDIGGKSEGLVAERAYKEAESFIKNLSVGDEVEGIVLIPETPDGYTILSLRQAAEEVSWNKVKEAYENAKPVKVEVKGVNPSGLIVDFEGFLGFVPMSQLGREASKNSQSLTGKKIEVVVIDFDKDKEKLILSEKEVSEKEELKRVREAMENVKEGQEFEGEVTVIYDFGCFVKINVPLTSGNTSDLVPLEGLVHISEMSWDKVDNPEKVVTSGQRVKVKVIGKKNGKLALSIKQASKDPWEGLEERYKKEGKYKGKVVKLVDFGVFVQLEPGVEGLVHITKIPPGIKFDTGREIDVYIEEIDKETKKISLGLVLTQKPVGYK